MKNKSASHFVLTGLFVVLVLAASNSIVRAQDCPGTTHWVGATGDWFDGTSWYLGCVPTYSSDASINNHGGATIDGGNDAMAKSLILGDNQGDSGGVTVAQSAVLDVGTGLLSCRSDIYIGYRGSGTLSLKSGGIVKSRYGYVAAVQNLTRPASNGTVTVEAGTTWYIFDTPTLGCTGAGLFIGCTAGSNGAGGTATVNLSGTIDVRSHAPGAGVKVGHSGTLSGNGILNLSGSTTAMPQTTVVYGTLAPGTGAGLTIVGNLDLSPPSANTVIHVTPLAETSESVHVYAFDGGSSGGQVTLGGRLTVIMTGSSFTPDTSFTLVHADGGRNNTTFESESIIYNDPYQPCLTLSITYDTHNVYLHIADCL